MKRIVLTVLALAISPALAQAQVVWDAPPMLRPGAPSGLSLFLLEPYPGNDLGVLVQWRRSPAPSGFGIRVGLAEQPGRDGDLAALVGLDISGEAARLGGSGDPQLMWWTGAGLGVGDELVATFPAGLVLGWNIVGDGVVFSPNIGAHVALDVLTGPGDDLELEGSLDLGVDLGFGSGIQVRFGASVADREALAIGIRLPG